MHNVWASVLPACFSNSRNLTREGQLPKLYTGNSILADISPRPSGHAAPVTNSRWTCIPRQFLQTFVITSFLQLTSFLSILVNRFHSFPDRKSTRLNSSHV